MKFAIGCVRLCLKGDRVYWGWVALLGLLILQGAAAYFRQLDEGLIATNMRDQVSWAFYIGNFTFLVGVAAAAVLLVIPAYVYNWKPIKEIAILGEIMAVSAIVMCLLFVIVDIGRPERFWHLIPVIGILNVPKSILGWDVIVLNGYMALNAGIVLVILFKTFYKQSYNKNIIVPLILFSIPLAISIHTVTAFVYNGMASRPFWNAAILAPRFIASAFCSGPAIMLVVFQILRRKADIDIKDEAIFKVAELMAYAMFLNLFLFGAEIFKEYYSDTHHLVHAKYLYQGLHGHGPLVPYAWLSFLCSVTAFMLFLFPKTRKRFLTLNIGCVLICIGVNLEKGIGLVLPGMTPDTLGEIYEYGPSMVEARIGAAIFAAGFLVFTLMAKVAVPIMKGEYTVDSLSSRGGKAAPAAPRTGPSA